MQIQLSSHYHHGAASPLWDNGFQNCCHRILGPAQHQMLGMALGGLVGSILGGQNPMLGLLGAALGGLMGRLEGHNAGHCCHHQHPSHGSAACYPPVAGHQFGGMLFGGFCAVPGGQFGQMGMPHWCPPGYRGGANFQFNFGHHSPQRDCWYRPDCRPRPQPHCRPCPRPKPRPVCRKDGRLCQKGKGKPISYTTSGGFKVEVNKHTISITDPSGKNTVQHWGDPHEKLNGKHIKDWQTKQRTVVLGDGTKITMEATGPKGVTLKTSIYDGRQNVQIENKTNTVTHHSFRAGDTRRREAAQYDGETAIFRMGRKGSAVYNNIYNQDANFGITRSYQRLGRTGGDRDPKLVQDFYDDPTLART